MRKLSNHAHRAELVPRDPARRRSFPLARTAAIVLGLSLLVAACGSSNGTSQHGSGSAESHFLAFTRCMRSHGIHDFPDPTVLPGGGVTFQMNAGPGSDLNRDNPTFEGASQACRALSPAGQQAPATSGQQIAQEVSWVHCLRSHGVPNFPDPSRNGSFNSGKFDSTSPAFLRASAACKSRQPSGAVSAAPGAP